MKKIAVVFSLLVAALFAGIFWNSPKMAEAKGTPDVCPNGDGWTKVEGLSGFSYTFSPIPPGFIVTDNCYKHATFVHYGTGDTVTADWHDDHRYELSHASFKVVDPSVTPTPIPTPTLVPTLTPTPTLVPTPTVQPTVTPVATPTFTPEPTVAPTSPSCGSDEHLDASGQKCVRFDDPGVPAEGPVTGQVLGASTMAGTGVAQDNAFAMLFAIGSVLISFGVRKFSTIKVK